MYTADDLASATNRIRRAEKRVREQDRLIVRLVEGGRDISQAQALLNEMIVALASMRGHRSYIAEQLGRLTPWV